ncbi:phosphotransferase [Hassallia byssoidea VB512170]|uniref:Phosphotransferase n=1 Tax=Hassallia byssoidea VB512170 TaxID=1304833 RepID=A0A846HF74_9CYAN|nr:phosphotransferase [Hassalia byssoidea]NEU75449.1 phosphotransferase [Hassalia byssoidea VB512170]
MDWNQLAQTALTQYNITDARLFFLGHSENVTFRIETSNSYSGKPAKFLFRIHHPIAQQSDSIWQQHNVIDSELLWLSALHRDTNLIVPKPMQNKNGTFVTSVAIDRKLPLNCTLMQWVEGCQISTQPTPTQAWQIGELMARLHQHTSVWELPLGFVRPKYDWEELQTSLMRLHLVTISDADFAVLETAVKQISLVMTALGKTRSSWGVIHADLNENNYIFHEDEARAIDFSRCGFGYYLYDIASTLLHLLCENRKAFLNGYQSVRLLPDDYQNILEAFFLAAMIHNFAFHASNPNEHDYLLENIPYLTETLCSRYLQGEPFLFYYY